jgi:hypothetical protein
VEVEKYMLHTIYKKIDELAQKLSSDFIKHLKAFPDYDNVVPFYVIALDYALEIEERFFAEDHDDEDFEVLNLILHLYDSVADLIVKYEIEGADEVTIEVDED